MIAPAVFAAALQVAFIPVDEAARLVGGGAAVIDVRGAIDFLRGHLPGAQRVDWKELREGWGRTGRLDGDLDRVARRLAELGVRSGRPVLVVGAAREGFGEEGRLAWTLAYLGHPAIRILDGGFAAWREAGRESEAGIGRAQARGDFMARPRAGLRAEVDGVKAALSDGKTVIVDARTRAEWDGARPYWESRPGHLPGARRVEWRDLIDDRGRLLDKAALERKLAGAGLAPSRPAIVYCTGGVRSAFVWAVLAHLGYADVRNYDGSMWEWSRREELPLVVGGAGGGE